MESNHLPLPLAGEGWGEGGVIELKNYGHESQTRKRYLVVQTPSGKEVRGKPYRLFGF